MINTNVFASKNSDRQDREQEEVKSVEIIQPGEQQSYFTSKGFARVIQFPLPKKRERLIVKKGVENISMLLKTIALFYIENNIVYAIDQFGKKYVAEHNLSALEQELDDRIFFRVNRQFIININHVKSFRSYEKIKLRVDMNPGVLNDQSMIIISQETAPAFRKWIYSV